MAKQRTNLRTVAKAAKVSLTTASRVLNGSSIPTEQTRKRVIKAAGELGYQLDPQFGQAIRRRRHGLTEPRQQTGLISLFMSPATGLNSQFPSDAHFGRGIAAIQKALNANDKHLLLQTSDDASEVLQIAAERELEGLLLWGAFKVADNPQAKYLCSQLPAVLIESSCTDCRADSVMLNASLAMRKQLEYLWDLGHRQIAYFEQSLVQSPQQQRLRAFTDFFQEKNIAIPLPELNKPHDITTATNDVALDRFADELVMSRPLPTALIAASNYALDLMHRLQDRGLRVPEDISVAGVNDDWLGGNLARPPLTAYHMPMDELGLMAVQLLINRIEKPLRPARHLLIDGHPLERASCAELSDQRATQQNVGQVLTCQGFEKHSVEQVNFTFGSNLPKP